MTHRERFQKIFRFEPVDRLPLYFFGAWPETKRRWIAEGFTGEADLTADAGPQLDGMDPDWETGLWNAHGLVKLAAIGDVEPVTLWERGERRCKRGTLGEEYVERTDGASISHTLVYPLQPNRASWARFRRFLDPADGRRYPADLQQKAAEVKNGAANGRVANDNAIGSGAANGGAANNGSTNGGGDKVLAFTGGSLYGWLRNWMGVEGISLLMYDDPALLEEMVSHLTDHFITLTAPVLKLVDFDFVYIFEDCCGSHGPLFSPAIYKSLFDKYYRKLISFYKGAGVPLALIDSDGKADALIPSWLGSGFDIIFPVEAGVWLSSPRTHREKFGAKLKMLGGVDKRLIYASEGELRAHLLDIKTEVDAGGFIPIPDHRIPPQVSYAQMRRYIEVFHEVFNSVR